MKVREAQIATQIMLGMQEAIDSNDKEMFVEYLNDGRANNCIIGNPEFQKKYCELCVKALHMFLRSH